MDELLAEADKAKTRDPWTWTQHRGSGRPNRLRAFSESKPVILIQSS